MKFRAAAAGPTISVKTSSTPTICAHSATATRDDPRNATDSEAHRHALGLGQFGLQAGEQQRPRDRAERREARAPAERQRGQRGPVDAEHVAEQQRRRLGGVGRVEMQEQQAEAERQRQHHADRDVALG